MSSTLRAERLLLPGSGTPPLDREFALLRLVNALMVAPLPLLAWWACRRLGLAGQIRIVAALVPFAVPQLTHIASTLNNDNLLTLLASVLTVLLAGVVRGDLSRRTAAAVGVVTGLSLLTKGFALMLPVVVTAAYALAWWRTRDRRRPSVGLLLAGVVSAALGGWWYLRNVLRGDGLSPTTENGRLTTDLQPPGFHPHPFTWLRKFVMLFTERFWGWFGWYTVRISIAVIIGATVILLVAIALGFISIRNAPVGRATDERTGAAPPMLVVGRLGLGIMLLPALLFGAFTMVRSWSLYAHTSLFPFIQGRYIFGGVVGVAVVAAVGLHRLTGRWAVAATFGWVVLMQAEGLRRVLSGYWGARGSGPIDQARALVAWSTWPDPLFAIGAVALLAATGWLAFEVVQTTGGGMAATSSGSAPKTGGGTARGVEPADPSVAATPATPATR